MVDALGYSTLASQTTPRLLDFFGEIGTLKRVRTLLGYSNAIIPSIFSGLYPQQHDIWALFKMSPATCPFKLINLFPQAIFDKSRFIRYFATQIIYAYSKKKLSIPKSMTPVNVPLRLLKYFDISLKKHITEPNALEPSITLFDLLRMNSIQFSYVGYPWDLGTENILSSTLHAVKNSPVTLCYLDEIDHEAHAYGIGSKKFIERIRLFDDTLTDFLRKVVKNDNISLMVFSDHGMRDVTGTVDLQRIVDNTGLTIEKDFLFFLDSTIARFWTFNEKARKVLCETLSSANGGRLLNQEGIRNFGINFTSDTYGDLFYLSDPGKLILPNFYTIRGGVVKGMHGWDPLDELQDSFLYINDGPVPNDLVDVTGYFSIMRTKMGI